MDSLEDCLFEVIAVAGHTALFTDGRIEQDELPNGVWCYQLRKSDSGIRFVSLEQHVGVNHGGSVITNEPIELGDRGFISFGYFDGKSPVFQNKRMTLKEFMEVCNAE